MSQEPVSPFGVTVDDVKALLPDAVLDLALDPTSGRRGVTAVQVQAWLAEWTPDVVEALDPRWTTLPEEQLTSVTATGRSVVATAVASIAQSARAGADDNAKAYAKILWDRYQSRLVQLATRVTVWLDDQTAGGVSLGPAAIFPAAIITDDIQF